MHTLKYAALYNGLGIFYLPCVREHVLSWEKSGKGKTDCANLTLRIENKELSRLFRCAPHSPRATCTQLLRAVFTSKLLTP